MKREFASAHPKTLIFFALTCLILAASAAADEAVLPADLAIALDRIASEGESLPAESAGDCAPADDAMQVELGGPITIKATCTADCGSSPDVSCTSGSCSAVNRNCAAGQRGYVTCGSSTTYCPVCGCTEGAIRYVTSSSCCCDYTIDWAPVNRRKLITERCVNGNWVYQGYSCSGQNCGGNCPL